MTTLKDLIQVNNLKSDNWGNLSFNLEIFNSISDEKPSLIIKRVKIMNGANGRWVKGFEEAYTDKSTNEKKYFKYNVFIQSLQNEILDKVDALQIHGQEANDEEWGIKF